MQGLRDALWPWPLLAALLVAGPALWHALRVRRLRTVFVSYRRSDSADHTTALVAALRQALGGRVFLDTDTLRPGEDFRAAIARTLWRCDAALVVIGPDWATTTLGAGRPPRLHEPDDVVRSEVAMALASGALVVPVLVDGARMPGVEQLPAELQALRGLNGLVLPAGDRAAQIAQLDDAIRRAPLRQSAAFLAGCHGAVLAALAAFAAVGGLADEALVAAFGSSLPGAGAVLAALVLQRLRPAAPARTQRVQPAALLLPLAFVALAVALVTLRSLNLLAGAPFQALLILTQVAFAAYSGSVLATLRENRSAP